MYYVFRKLTTLEEVELAVQEVGYTNLTDFTQITGYGDKLPVWWEVPCQVEATNIDLLETVDNVVSIIHDRLELVTCLGRIDPNDPTTMYLSAEEYKQRLC